MNGKDISDSTLVESTRSLSQIIIDDTQHLLDASLAHLPAIVLGSLIFIIAFMASGPISRFLIKPFRYKQQSPLLQNVSRRIISTLVVLLGLYLFLRLVGLTQFALAIISSTGLAGLILGFAFKDIAENFISSLLLSVQKPFALDDVIEVDGSLGVVQSVTSRATTLVDFDGNHIQIPNSIIYKNKIKNLTANPLARIKFSIGIDYNSSIVLAQDIAYRVMANEKTVLNDPEPLVAVDNLGSSTVNLDIYFWIKVTEHSPLKMKSMMIRKILRAMEAENIGMPDDARERIFPEGIKLIETREDRQVAVQKIQGAEARSSAKQSQINQHDITKTEDTSSETDNIRKQAQETRTPENGDNIL